eukprot:103420_1
MANSNDTTAKNPLLETSNTYSQLINHKHTSQIKHTETNESISIAIEMGKQLHDNNNTNHLNNITDFIEPLEDDYVSCNQQITQCRAVQRVIHLLKYYQSAKSQKINDIMSTIQIYEYIKAITDSYEVFNVMEDWHHIKMIHLVNNHEDILYFDKFKDINCVDNDKCIYLKRYHRVRDQEGYEINKEIDHKNLILSQIHFPLSENFVEE